MTWVKASALLLAVLSLCAAAGAADSNLLLVTVDTLRPDRLGCYSPAHARTPAIDAFAARGAVFENAYAHNPSTLPSHTNILVGMTPLYHGVSGNSKAKLSEAFLTLAEHLKKQGYATGAFIGAFPLDSRFGLNQGFDVYDDALPSKGPAMGFFQERKAQQVVAAASAWISKQTGKWFCWVHLWDPHAPYAPPEPYLTEYRNDPYSGEVAYVDAQLSRLFEELRKKQAFDQTLICLTADHGESLGEHGEMTHDYFAYGSTLHVPLIISGPGVRPARVPAVVCHIDIFPTVCGLLGVPEPPGLQGRSLSSLMKGRKPVSRPVYFESLEPYLNYGCAPLRGFIDGRTKFIDTPVPEVYDLGADPGEATNLAPKTDLAPLRKKLEDLKKALSGPAAKEGPAVADRQTLERLRSLGYVMSPVARRKTSYGPADDLKTFLPFQQRLERAVLLSDAGKDEECVRELAALIREKKDFTPAYTYLSQHHMWRGRLAEALRTLEEGVQANPDDYTLLSEFGTALIQAQQWGRAVGILEKALSLIDYDPESWDNLGIAHMKLGEYAKSLEYFEKALSVDGAFALAYGNMGAVRLTMYLEEGRKPEDLDAAMASFQRAAALNPNQNLTFRGLGYAFRTAGRDEEAAAAWEKAIAIDPTDDFSTLNLGLVCFEKGDKPRARRLLEKYLALKGPAISARERDGVQSLIEKCKLEIPS